MPVWAGWPPTPRWPMEAPVRRWPCSIRPAQMRQGLVIWRWQASWRSTARALVALDRTGEAEAALNTARRDAAQDPDAWLLSATLARRLGKLSDAQFLIETAARLNPVDPEVGLEAGVIAVLSGRDEAARKSWQSVIAAAPGSAPAALAKSYIDQLGGN